MKIALLADTRKNELLVNFCIAYSHILAKHDLVSFFSTSRILEINVNLSASALVGNSVAAMGQLASRAMYNELDAIIYLRDTQLGDNEDCNILFRACDDNNIPYATSLASAEILVLAIDRGDLDWRELI